MQIILLLAKKLLNCNNYIAYFKIKGLQENSDRKI